MFYSHEVLTDRKYGLAVVWLTATIGASSSHRRVSRRQILDVDVTKACETIIAPEAPLALRLQSNLLFGLTSVYARQCGYVLHDAEVARNNMRTITNLLHQAALEPANLHKASSQQLNLQDDPNFDLDVLPVELDYLNASLTMEDETQSMLSPYNSQSTIGSQHTIGGLIMPTDSSLMANPLSGVDLLGERASADKRTSVQPPQFFEDDLGLSFEAEGAMTLNEVPLVQATYPSRVVGSYTPAAGDACSNPQTVLAEEQHRNDDYEFSDLVGDNTVGQVVSNFEAQESPPQQVEAFSRERKPEKKTLQLDSETTLRNSDLTGWNKDYLERMAELSREVQGRKLAALAKQNAQHWFMGAGMLLGRGMHRSLDLFSAANLLKSFTGVDVLAHGQKRARQDAQSNERPPKRSRGESMTDELVNGFQSYDEMPARNHDVPTIDDEMHIMNDDTIEQGREAPTPFDDRQLSSLFPWNQSAGSRQPTDAHPTSNSFGGVPLQTLHSRRSSRLTSASPLVRHGQTGPESDDGLQLPVSEYSFREGMAEEEFELYGPAAQVDTQTAAHTQWQRAVLGAESVNFLRFLQAAIEEDNIARQSAAPGNNNDDGLDGSVNFETILTPARNSQIVAAQALIHILALGTEGLIVVAQKEAFGPINVRIVGT